MEYYWQNVKIEFLEDPKQESSTQESPFLHQEHQMNESDSNISIDTTLSAMEFDMDEVLDQNFNPSELDDFIEYADPDALIEESEALEIDTDSLIEEVYEEVYEPPRNPMRKVREVVQVASMPFFCGTCTLDFPSEAYLVRHYNTKKHKRALNMEERGKKVNQKRKYVRKNSCKMQQVQTVCAVENSQPFQVIPNAQAVEEPQFEVFEELSVDDIAFLEAFDQKDKNVSMKNFYENFDLEI